MPDIVAGAGYATFINTFRCAPEDQETVVQLNVDITQRVAREFPGFVSATVHRSLDGTRVINHLQWRTAADLAAMQRSAQFQEIARGFAGLIEFDPHEVEIVHIAADGG
jgi:heme-degrading monooxygenase HmoA